MHRTPIVFAILIGACDGDVGGSSTPVTCNQQNDRTITHADGSRSTITANMVALDVGPDDDFTLEQCGAFPAAECPAGASCSGGTLPPGTACSRSHRSGLFIGGQLVVTCSTRIENFSPTGSVTSSSTTGYASTLLTMY